MLADTFGYLTDGARWSGPNGIGAFAIQQLLLTVTALAIAMAIGLPLALYLGHRRRGGFLAVNVSNVGRAVPGHADLACISSPAEFTYCMAESPAVSPWPPYSASMAVW